MGIPRRFVAPPLSQNKRFNKAATPGNPGLFQISSSRCMKGLQTINQQSLLLFRNQTVNLFGSSVVSSANGLPCVPQSVPTSSMIPTMPSSVQGGLQPMSTSTVVLERSRQTEEYR